MLGVWGDADKRAAGVESIL